MYIVAVCASAVSEIMWTFKLSVRGKATLCAMQISAAFSIIGDSIFFLKFILRNRQRQEKQAVLNATKIYRRLFTAKTEQHMKEQKLYEQESQSNFLYKCWYHKTLQSF